MDSDFAECLRVHLLCLVLDCQSLLVAAHKQSWHLEKYGGQSQAESGQDADKKKGTPGQHIDRITASRINRKAHEHNSGHCHCRENDGRAC